MMIFFLLHRDNNKVKIKIVWKHYKKTKNYTMYKYFALWYQKCKTIKKTIARKMERWNWESGKSSLNDQSFLLKTTENLWETYTQLWFKNNIEAALLLWNSRAIWNAWISDRYDAKPTAAKHFPSTLIMHCGDFCLDTHCWIKFVLIIRFLHQWC